MKADERLSRLRDLADVEVGITTGANPFFTVPRSVVDQFNLCDYARPMVGRSVQICSAVFTKKDWMENQKREVRSNLLVFPSMVELRKNRDALAYLDRGVKEGIDKGYKCRIRDEWQIIPSLWISDALFLRRNNLYPKFAINRAKAYTTDTMHRVKVRKGVDIKALVTGYYNSLSLAFTEICGRSHGGGVLELMPGEVENVIIPYDRNHAELLDEIDDRLRKNEGIDKILENTNRLILKDGLGFSDGDIKLTDGIWKKLSERRMNRGSR